MYQKEKYTIWCPPPDRKLKGMMFCVNEEGIVICGLKLKGTKSMINKPDTDFEIVIDQ